MDGLKMLYPEPAAPSGGAAEGDDDDGEVALRLHRALHARPARRRGRAEAAGGAEEDDDGEEEEEEEEVKIRLLEMAVKAELEEDVKVRLVAEGAEDEAGSSAAGGGQRRGVKREREEAAPGWRGASAGGQQGGRVGKKSRFRGVSERKGAKTKPWMAQIHVTKDGKPRKIHIGNFAREEDAARAYDRVSIAKPGHAKAKTNFPAAEYRAEWAELEALGVEGAAARKKQ